METLSRKDGPDLSESDKVEDALQEKTETQVSNVSGACSMKEPKKGVVYISRIPPFMSVAKLRHYMSKFGDVGRIFLNPEDPVRRKNRIRAGGSTRELFIDGWVEFNRKSVAKVVALALNNSPVGGRKRHNFWRDDIWNIKYLPRFKWHDLMEFLTHKRRDRENRKKFELIQAKKESSHYLEQAAKKRRRDRIAAEQASRQAKRVAREATTD